MFSSRHDLLLVGTWKRHNVKSCDGMLIFCLVLYCAIDLSNEKRQVCFSIAKEKMLLTGYLPSNLIKECCVAGPSLAKKIFFLYDERRAYCKLNLWISLCIRCRNFIEKLLQKSSYLKILTWHNEVIVMISINKMKQISVRPKT